MKTSVLPFLFTGAALATGCVSYVNDFTQPMKIETRAADGTLVAGADCQLQNDKASQTMKSGDTVGVRRSSEPLQIRCKHPAHPDAVAQALPRINTSMIGNVLFGGGTAAAVRPTPTRHGCSRCSARASSSTAATRRTVRPRPADRPAPAVSAVSAPGAVPASRTASRVRCAAAWRRRRGCRRWPATPGAARRPRVARVVR
jgi:hypothetical protein